MSDSSGSDEFTETAAVAEFVSSKEHVLDNEKALLNSMPPLPPYHPDPQK